MKEKIKISNKNNKDAISEGRSRSVSAKKE